MSANAIEIRGLEKRFSKFTLGPIDITVPTGAIYGFVGPNGAGKTTTLDLIYGLVDKHAGSIAVLGLDHRRDEVAMKSQVAYVSPEIKFHAWSTVGKTIAFVRGFYPTWDDDYCERFWKDKIQTLSFGGPIKLAMLLALSWRPKLLILDEPTVGLDAIAKRQVFAELLEAVREGNRTVLISSHGLSDLERFADHIGMIAKGRMLVEGPTGEVTERYRMVDFVAADPFAAPVAAGSAAFVVQRREGDRWRAIVDCTIVPLKSLAGRGAQVIADSPVTMEELFIALGKERV